MSCCATSGRDSIDVFVAYRVVLAAVVVVVWLAPVGDGEAMEVMKQLRQRAIRDLVETAPDPDPAGARGRPPRARLPDDPGDDQPRRRRARAHQGRRARGRRPTRCRRASIEAETSGEDRLRKLLRDLPIEIHEAGLLLVLRTLPGSAHAIAAALDRARWPEVAGSIAGDDTLFVALPGPWLAPARQAAASLRLAEGS